MRNTVTWLGPIGEDETTVAREFLLVERKGVNRTRSGNAHQSGEQLMQRVSESVVAICDYVISAFAAMIDFAPKSAGWSEFKNLIQIKLDSEHCGVTELGRPGAGMVSGIGHCTKPRPITHGVGCCTGTVWRD